jgi:hypothetical protein
VRYVKRPKLYIYDVHFKYKNNTVTRRDSKQKVLHIEAFLLIFEQNEGKFSIHPDANDR